MSSRPRILLPLDQVPDPLSQTMGTEVSPGETPTHRIALGIAYDGRSWQGWQKQPHAQTELRSALSVRDGLTRVFMGSIKSSTSIPPSIERQSLGCAEQMRTCQLRYPYFGHNRFLQNFTRGFPRHPGTIPTSSSIHVYVTRCGMVVRDGYFSPLMSKQ